MSDTEPHNVEPNATEAAQRTRRWSTRKIAGTVVGLVLLVGVIAAGRWFFTCPCDRMPGAVLWGEVVEEPISDWTFANQVELCQIQVTGPIIPQALNLNCMATAEGELYLSCSGCEPKRWSRLAIRNGDGRIRLDGLVYPVHFTHVTDPAEADRSWEARLAKLENSTVLGGGTPVGTPRPPDAQWWTFRVESRAN
ncbi:MAG TPA: hypothetical protein VNR18_13895 [Hyphomicrobiales bacterium]|nr:hypothetical protein [Hyphomicrobiales bacterium]